MEIERKFLIKQIPFDLSPYKCRHIEQGYLSIKPVVRIRKEVSDGESKFELTYKSKGLMVREEYNLPLDNDSYEHLKEKIDGQLIVKDRYNIPLNYNICSDRDDLSDVSPDAEYLKTRIPLVIELDIFHGELAPLMLAEVEFLSEELAESFIPPEWFGRDVTMITQFQNSNLSRKKRIIPWANVKGLDD